MLIHHRFAPLHAGRSVDLEKRPLALFARASINSWLLLGDYSGYTAEHALKYNTALVR